MLPHQHMPEPPLPSSPRFFFSSSSTHTSASHRRVAIAVDPSDESAHAVRWAVRNYLRPGDAVVLLHVSPTPVLYGADWGPPDSPSSCSSSSSSSPSPSPRHHPPPPVDDPDAFTPAKAEHLARPLAEAKIPFKVHVVKDHDMKERICLEVERLGIGAVIMGSRGFGASRKSGKGGLGSVSDYCVHHCVCPVIVVRYPEDGTGGGAEGAANVPEFHPKGNADA